MSEAVLTSPAPAGVVRRLSFLANCAVAVEGPAAGRPR